MTLTAELTLYPLKDDYLAVIRGFPGGMVAVDLIWGTVLTGSVAAAGYGFGRWLGVGVGS